MNPISLSLLHNIFRTQRYLNMCTAAYPKVDWTKPIEVQLYGGPRWYKARLVAKDRQSREGNTYWLAYRSDDYSDESSYYVKPDGTYNNHQSVRNVPPPVVKKKYQTVIFLSAGCPTSYTRTDPANFWTGVPGDNLYNNCRVINVIEGEYAV